MSDTEAKSVIVYIDYENIHNILRKYFTNAIDKDLFEKIKHYCDDNNLKIMDIIAYCNFDIDDLHESYHQTWLLQHDIEIKHTSNKGKNYADLQIAVDVLEQVYCNNIVDGFVILSSDKDMIPLIKAIKRRNKIAHLITTVKDCDYGVNVFPDKHELLEHILEIKDKSGNEIKPEIFDVKSEIYNNLQNLIARQNYRHTNFDYYINSIFPRFRIPRYEIFKNLKLLEEESKINFYKYTYNTKEIIALITDSELKNYSSNYGNNITIINGYLTNQAIEDCYKQYIKD